MGQRTEDRTVQAVETALDIIEILRERGGAGVTELASEMDVSKGTVHTHLATLRERNYVTKEDGAYQLSLKYLDLGQAVREQLSGFDIVRRELDSLAEKTGELAQFATEEHGKAVYLYKSAGENAVQTASSPGTREYMHTISLGKAMLAHMPEDRVDEIVTEHGLQEYTDQTITSPDLLRTQLADIRDRGVAFDEEERFEGIRCVAAPVMAKGKIFGAVSVSGPAARMRGERYREELPEMVTRSANVIEINAKFA